MLKEYKLSNSRSTQYVIALTSINLSLKPHAVLVSSDIRQMSEPHQARIVIVVEDTNQLNLNANS